MNLSQETPESIRCNSAAVRVKFTWIATSSAFSAEHKRETAQNFDANESSVSGRKKILDTKHPAIKALTEIRGRIRAYWIGATLPYPEPGIRLIRRADIERFDATMQELRAELDVATANLRSVYAELRDKARNDLGRLWDERDYPDDVTVSVEWDFPSTEPPEYLKQLNPSIYESECQRAAARFDEAIRLSEEAFAAELAKMLAHLAERLGDGSDGKKVFRDSAVNNLHDFFDRFTRLSVRSSEQLDALVSQARSLINPDVSADSLRETSPQGRAEIAQQLSAVSTALEENIVTAPRRSLVFTD